MKPRRARNLKEYAMAKKRAGCRVCQLPEPVKRELLQRNRHIVSLDTALQWIKEEWSITISEKEYLLHTRAGHWWRSGKFVRR